MKKVYSARDIDELHRGGGLGSIPSDAIITPSARDRMKELGADKAKRNGSPAKGGGIDLRPCCATASAKRSPTATATASGRLAAGVPRMVATDVGREPAPALLSLCL